MTDTGHVEMDALIMDGRSLSCGAVASVSGVRHPVELARCVMDHTDHTLLVAHGAETLADQENMERVSYLLVESLTLILIKGKIISQYLTFEIYIKLTKRRFHGKSEINKALMLIICFFTIQL